MLIHLHLLLGLPEQLFLLLVECVHAETDGIIQEIGEAVKHIFDRFSPFLLLFRLGIGTLLVELIG